MNNEIRLYKKLIILITMIFAITLASVVLYYESNTSVNVIGDTPIAYHAQEIRNMIKKLSDYQGDSLLIDDNNQIRSLDGLIQSVIVQMYLVDVNIAGIKNEAKITGMPEPYIVYKTAIKYYIAQYGSKTKKSDSLNIK